MATFLTTDRRTEELRTAAFAGSPLGPPSVELSDDVRWLFEELAFVWKYFDELLAEIPIVERIESSTVTLQDYKDLLLNIRQQVIEGGRWLALAASSFSIELFPVRSAVIVHAVEEHKDYQLLEQNYLAVGGDLLEILTYPKNVGSEALNAYMFHTAQQPNPLNAFGAVFIIEGLGSAKAAGWAKNIKEALGVGDEAVTFLAYHGENDDTHYERLRALLSNPLIDRSLGQRIAKTAKVVARLYALQLEELGERLMNLAGPGWLADRRPLDRRTRRIVRTTVVRPDRPRPQVARSGRRDRVSPSLWEAMAVDPNLHVPPESMALQICNLQRYQRRHVAPIVKAICGFIIRNGIRIKRVLPHSLGSERALNWLAPRFLAHWCSPETLELVLRHFAVESNLINFVARNCGADDVHEVDLYPRSAWDVAAHTDTDGSTLNAVCRHDANIFNLVIDLGESETADVFTQRPLDQLDFSMLEIPAFDIEPGRRRIMNLDLESALHITVATLLILMDFRTAERAVNSFQLDESMASSLANLTGDPTFRAWNPAKFGNWLGHSDDIGRDLYLHIACNEYAHERLRWMAVDHG